MNSTTEKSFRVTNSVTGHDFGIYHASSEEEAIQAMLDDAGHDGPADPDVKAVEVPRVRVELAAGEVLLLATIAGKEEVLLLSPGDAEIDPETGEAGPVPMNVYGSLDWRHQTAPSYEIDEDGDLRANDGTRCYGPVIPYRRAEGEALKRAERLFVETFGDGLRVVDAPAPVPSKDDERRDAEARARALTDAFGGSGASASAYQYQGSWYVVTTGTGEGYDFAYDVEDVDPADVSRPRVKSDDGDVVSGWDYSEWCTRVSPVTDLDVATLYYVATGRRLGQGGGGSVLSAEQIKALDIVRAS